MDPDEEFIHKDETYNIIVAGFEVYNELGCAYLELIYQEAYERELALQSIPFASQAPLRVSYKGECLNKNYYADLIAYQKVIVELKVLEKLTSREESQIINYLKAAGLQVGLLLNFGSHPKLEYKRIVLQLSLIHI